MKLRIFVIDDEECITDTFKWHLTDQGHEVICLSCPMEFSFFQGGPCDHWTPCADILFTDLNMSKMTGLDFIEMLQNKGCVGIAKNSVLMSGSLSKEDIQRAFGLGCKIMQKPITLSQIDSVIDEMKKNIPADRKLADLFQ